MLNKTSAEETKNSTGVYFYSLLEIRKKKLVLVILSSIFLCSLAIVDFIS